MGSPATQWFLKADKAFPSPTTWPILFLTGSQPPGLANGRGAPCEMGTWGDPGFELLGVGSL